MIQLLFLLIAVLACLSMAAAAGLLVVADRNFNARLATRVAGEAADDRAAGVRAALLPRAVRLLTRWGETAGKGAIENERRAALRLRLIQACFYGAHAPEAFFGLRVLGCAVLAALGLLAGLALHLKGPLGLMGPLILAANVGYVGPNLWLGRRIAERANAMKHALPDAIDLMVVSVEAGATLTAAIQRLVVEFRELHPVLCEQFAAMLTQLQAGASRADALTRLAQRCPAEELGAFTTMLIQSEAVGASLGATLRVFADELRTARFLEAERKAAELPVKLAFPLVLCILPCLTMTIMIPVGIQMVRGLLDG